MPDAARELAEAGAAYAGRDEEGPRPNPATHGDAQEGVEPRVSSEYEAPGAAADAAGSERAINEEDAG
jgi:hypothetical protein